MRIIEVMMIRQVRDARFCLGMVLLMIPFMMAPSPVPESKSSHEFTDAFRLSKLNNADMAAGAKEVEKYYADSFNIEIEPNAFGPVFYRVDVGQGIGMIHGQGHILPPKQLGSLFLGTVFRFYVRQFLGYDFSYNYDGLLQEKKQGLKLLSYQKRKIRESCVFMGMDSLEENLPEFLKLINTIQKGFEAFQKNQELVDLGIAYMRQKVVVEKLHTVLEKLGKSDPAQSEKVQKLMYKHDRYAIDLQTMIFHWMKDGFAEFAKHNKKPPLGEHGVQGAFLERYQPEFLDAPYYHGIMEHLKEWMAPIPKVDGIDL